jgi:hypothetical protein
MFGSDLIKPYGRVWIHGDENSLDCNWDGLNCFTNVTVDSSAIGNTIKMSPYYQSASTGVVTNGGTSTSLDYGHMLRTAAPASGYWYRGSAVWNAESIGGGSPGWVCTATGSPGTWKTMAALGA